MKGLAVVVDGYGPARLMPPFFHARAHGLLHVQSTREPLPGFTRHDPAAYLGGVVHRGDAGETIRALETLAAERGLPITCVVPGIEAGVDLADALGEAMGLPGNGTGLGRARRDKYLMAARLHELGVPAVAHSKAASADEILAWVERTTTFPVVVKPLDSGGTDGVFVCQDAGEVRAAVQQVLGRTNLMGQENREALVQAFLRGDEYVVNSASHAGRHVVTDVWRCRKRFLPGRGFIYDREELLPFEQEIPQRLVAYVRRVLDALGVRFGPSHAEVMMTERGPVLIEVGARVSGAVNPAMADECCGYNQLALGVDAYVDPAAFERALVDPPRLRKHAMLVVLACEREGVVRDVGFVDALRALPSVRNLAMRVAVGDTWRRTVDLKSSPGHLHLVAERREDLERDYEAIWAIMRDVVAKLA